MLTGTLTSGRKWTAYAGCPDVDVYGVNAYRRSAYPKMEWLPAYCVSLTESELAELTAITTKLNAASERGWANEEEWWEFISEAAVFAAWDRLQERLDLAGIIR